MQDYVKTNRKLNIHNYIIDNILSKKQKIDNETKKTIIESLNTINSKISTLESNYFKKLKAKVDKVLLNETIKDSN